MQFECQSDELAKWNVSGGHFSNNVLVKSNIVYIVGVNLANEGVYECEGRSHEVLLRTGEPVKTFSRVSLVIEGKCQRSGLAMLTLWVDYLASFVQIASLFNPMNY